MSHSSSITNPNVFLEMTRPTQPLIGLPADSKTSWDSQLTANSCANASPPPPKKKKKSNPCVCVRWTEHRIQPSHSLSCRLTSYRNIPSPTVCTYCTPVTEFSWSDFVFPPFTETELFFALLFVHSAVAVQVVQSPPFLPALTGGGGGSGLRWPAVLFALFWLENGGHVLSSVACDVGHVFTSTSSCTNTINHQLQYQHTSHIQEQNFWDRCFCVVVDQFRERSTHLSCLRQQPISLA